MTKTYINLISIDDTKKIAEIVASNIKAGDILALKGDLGSGKTTFSSYLIKFLTDVENVTSPTFNIKQEYYGKDNIVFHFDLYRIKSVIELSELGIEDCYKGITLIEWPEILIDNYKKLKFHELFFNIDIDGDRSLSIPKSLIK